jgi:hypothetical protein
MQENAKKQAVLVFVIVIIVVIAYSALYTTKVVPIDYKSVKRGSGQYPTTLLGGKEGMMLRLLSIGSTK